MDLSEREENRESSAPPVACVGRAAVRRLQLRRRGYANGPFPVAGIVRYRISDGAVSPVASFAPPGLSDACSFSISPATNRWYVHYEGTGIFRSGDETLAAADMIASPRGPS